MTITLTPSSFLDPGRTMVEMANAINALEQTGGGGGVIPTTPSTLDPAATYLAALSNGNLTLTASKAGALSFSTTPHSTGKWHVEVTLNSGGGAEDQGFGIASSNVDVVGGLGDGAKTSVGIWTGIESGANAVAIWWGNVAQTTFAAGGAAAGDTMAVEIDFDAQLLWFRASYATQWNNSSTASPAAGTGGVSFAAWLPKGTPCFFSCCPGLAAYVQTVNFGGAPFAIAPSSGFAAWNSSNDPVAYLPLTGGTLIGDLTIGGGANFIMRGQRSPAYITSYMFGTNLPLFESDFYDADGNKPFDTGVGQSTLVDGHTGWQFWTSVSGAGSSGIGENSIAICGPGINSIVSLVGATEAAQQPRWQLNLSDGTAETGSNQGSNLTIQSYADAGALLATPLTIARATGLATVIGDPVAPLGVVTKQYVDARVRTRLSANLSLYVATTGSDTTGNGSSGNPWATISNAVNQIAQNYDFCGYTIFLNVGAGTYGAVKIGGLVGGGLLQITGAGVGSTIVSVPSTPNIAVMVAGNSGTDVYINAMTLSAYTCLYITESGAEVYVGDRASWTCSFGFNPTSGGTCIQVSDRGYCEIVDNGAITVTPVVPTSMAYAIYVTGGAQFYTYTSVWTFSGPPVTFTTFARVTSQSYAMLHKITGAGSAVTGKQFNITYNSSADGSNMSSMPGSVAGTWDGTSQITGVSGAVQTMNQTVAALATANVANSITGQKNGLSRIGLVLGDAGNETGSNAGSGFSIQTYTDAGAVLATPFKIARATNIATFGGQVNVNGSNASSATVATFYNETGTVPTYPNGVWLQASNDRLTTTVLGYLDGSKPNPVFLLQSRMTTNPGWTISMPNGDARTGSNVGANFDIYAANDSANPMPTALHIDRATTTITVPNAIVVSSDAKLKTEVSTIEHALDIVAKLTGVRFTAQNGQRQLGFVAQDMQPHLPEAVVATTTAVSQGAMRRDAEGRVEEPAEPAPEETTLGIAYSSLTAVLANAVNELAAKLGALDERLKAVEAARA